MQHSRIIDELTERLGGQRELARRFGVDSTTICHWKDDGIPARHWVRLLDVARRARYRLTLHQISYHSPLRRRKDPSVPRGL